MVLCVVEVSPLFMKEQHVKGFSIQLEEPSRQFTRDELLSMLRVRDAELLAGLLDGRLGIERNYDPDVVGARTIPVDAPNARLLLVVSSRGRHALARGFKQEPNGPSPPCGL